MRPFWLAANSRTTRLRWTRRPSQITMRSPENLAQQMLQELDGLRRSHRSGEQPEIEPEPGDASYRAQRHPAEVACSSGVCPLRRPGAAAVWALGQSAHVDENNGLALRGSFFLGSATPCAASAGWPPRRARPSAPLGAGSCSRIRAGFSRRGRSGSALRSRARSDRPRMPNCLALLASSLCWGWASAPPDSPVVLLETASSATLRPQHICRVM